MARASLSLFLLSSLILCACLQPVHAGRYLQQLNLGGLVGGLLGTVANLGQTVTQLLGGPSTSNDAGGELQNLNLISEVTRRFIQQNPQYNGTEIPPSVFQSLMQSVGLLSLPGLSVGLTSPDVKEIVRTLRAPTILSQMAGNDLAGFVNATSNLGDPAYVVKEVGFVSVTGVAPLGPNGVLIPYDTQVFTVAFEDPHLIAFVYRGTSPTAPTGFGPFDLLSDALAFPQVPYGGSGCTGCLVSPGFQQAFQVVTTGSGDPSNDIKASMEQTYIRAYGVPPTNVTRVLSTGHSLGGTLATFTALWAIDQYPTAEVTMINLGSPRVGNPAFAQFFDSRIPAGRRYRMVNNMDVVPSVPALLLNGFLYEHVCRTEGVIFFERDLNGNVQAKAQDRPLFYTGSLPDHRASDYLASIDYVLSH